MSCDKPILIYSDHCEFSKNFLTILTKYPELFESFIRMNIDVQINTKQRPRVFYQLQESLNVKITKVPTIITLNGEYILSDKDAFRWLENKIKEITSQELLGFETNLSLDNYSTFGSTDICDSKSKSYKAFDKEGINDNYLQTNKGWDPSTQKTNGFLNELEKMSDSTDYNTKQSERLSFDKTNISQIPNKNIQTVESFDDVNSKYDSYEQQRKNPQQQQRQNIDFTSPNFGMGGELNKSINISQKQKDTDGRLEKMMLERKATNDILNQRPQY